MSIGSFLLSVAVTYGKLDSVKILLANNAQIDGYVVERVFSTDEELDSKNRQKGRLHILDYLIENGIFVSEYDHCVYGKCDPIWLCAWFGTGVELKKLLEHSTEGIHKFFGEKHQCSPTNALHQALDHRKPEFKLTNVKLLLEYGADPNCVFKGLTVLHMVLYSYSHD